MPSGSQVGPPPVPPTPLDLSSSAPPSARAVQHISLASCRFEEPGSGNDAQITDPASQRTVVPLLPVPLVQRQEVLERVRAQGWEALTVEALSQTCSQACPKSAMHFQEAIGSRTAFRDELRHGCPCCGQWCASPSSVEVHLSRTYVHWTDKRASLMKHVIACQQTHLHRCHVITVGCVVEAHITRHVVRVFRASGHCGTGPFEQHGQGTGDRDVPASHIFLPSFSHPTTVPTHTSRG